MNHNPFIHDHNPFCPFTVEGTLFRHGQEIKKLEATKQDKLTAGPGISIDEDNVISATGGGGGGDSTVLDLSNDEPIEAALQVMIDEAPDTVTTIILPHNNNANINLNLNHNIVEVIGTPPNYSGYRYILTFPDTERETPLTLRNGRFSVPRVCSNRSSIHLFVYSCDIDEIAGTHRTIAYFSSFNYLAPSEGLAVSCTFTGQRGLYIYNRITLIDCRVEKVSSSALNVPLNAGINAFNTTFTSGAISGGSKCSFYSCNLGNMEFGRCTELHFTDCTCGDLSFTNWLNLFVTFSGSTIKSVVNNGTFNPILFVNSTLTSEPTGSGTARYTNTKVAGEWR